MSTILAVDDSGIMLKIIQGSVDMMGYNFLSAKDGQEGLSVLAKHYEEIQLILLDWNMPVLNGYETLKLIKAESRFAHIPVMMVTTESEKENIVKAIQAGAKHYVTKPFSPEDLMMKMMECLGMGVS